MTSVHWVLAVQIQEKQRRQEEQRKRHLEAAALLGERNADGYVDEGCGALLGAAAVLAAFCFQCISVFFPLS